MQSRADRWDDEDGLITSTIDRRYISRRKSRSCRSGSNRATTLPSHGEPNGRSRTTHRASIVVGVAGVAGAVRAGGSGSNPIEPALSEGLGGGAIRTRIRTARIARMRWIDSFTSITSSYVSRGSSQTWKRTMKNDLARS